MSFLWILIFAAGTLVTFAIGEGTNDLANLCAGLFFCFAAALYFSPAMVASGRKHPNQASISILNLLLGWTAIGWVAALVWAYSDTPTTKLAVAKSPAEEPFASNVVSRKCPECAEEIRAEAKKCRFCGSEVEPAPSTLAPNGVALEPER